MVRLRTDADVLFERGKKSGERNAHGIKSGSKAFAAEDVPCVLVKKPSGAADAADSGINFDARAHLRRARSVSHHSRQSFPGTDFNCAAAGFAPEGRERHGQDEGPQDSEPVPVSLRVTSPEPCWLPPWSVSVRPPSP